MPTTKSRRVHVPVGPIRDAAKTEVSFEPRRSGKSVAIHYGGKVVGEIAITTIQGNAQHSLPERQDGQERLPFPVPVDVYRFSIPGIERLAKLSSPRDMAWSIPHGPLDRVKAMVAREVERYAPGPGRL